MKLLDNGIGKFTSYAHAQGKFILLGARKIYWNAQKILLDARLMQGKFTGCMAVASERIIRAHTLHGANSWSVKKKSMLLNQSDCRDS